MKIKVGLKLLEHFDIKFDLPRYETEMAAGMDIRACLPNKTSMIVGPKQKVLVPTGLSVEIPPGYEVQIRPRSGLSFKTNLVVANSPGTIDADYRGEVKVIIWNSGDEECIISHGDRIAQMVLSPVYQCEFEVKHDLTETERGLGGFGSTGVQ